jgi:two-component system, response regulator PdtaR
MSVTNLSPSGLNGRVVLLVEDERSLLTALAAFLRLKGVAVVEAESGDQALELLQGGERVDLVLSDVEMPGSVNGMDLAKWIRINRPALPVVLTSGRQVPDIEDVSFLAKPYRLGELLPIIEGAS